MIIREQHAQEVDTVDAPACSLHITIASDWTWQQCYSPVISPGFVSLTMMFPSLCLCYAMLRSVSVMCRVAVQFGRHKSSRKDLEASAEEERQKVLLR